jgi:hypothetical protein
VIVTVRVWLAVVVVGLAVVILMLVAAVVGLMLLLVPPNVGCDKTGSFVRKSSS